VPVPLRPAVSALPAYVAGRPAPTRPDLVTYKLSSNENPFPPLPGVLEAVALASAAMNRYPDIANTLMSEALGARLGVDADRFAFGAGSVGVLYHLLQAVCGPGDEVVHAWRSFEAYPIAVLLTGARWVGVPLDGAAEHDLDAMLAAVGPDTRAVLLCSPNNPTGPALRHDDVVAFVESVPDHVLVVVDEAYVEFVTDPDAVRGLEVGEGRIDAVERDDGVDPVEVGRGDPDPGPPAGPVGDPAPDPVRAAEVLGGFLDPTFGQCGPDP
jgi:histidinol-phosphate aminotransferase